MINDLAVNPISGNVYLSVSRGRGPDAAPVLLRVDADGKLDEVALENVRFAKAEIPNPPDPGARQRGQPLRNESITDLAYVDGRVFVAGLSNEEFSSRLIAIPFPFSDGLRRRGDRDLPRRPRPVRDQVAGPDLRRLPDQQRALPAGGLHLHAAGQGPRRRAQGRRPRQGDDHRRAGQPQPAARHDRLPEGRQGLPAAGQQQPGRDEDPDRRGGLAPRASPRRSSGRPRASATRRSPSLKGVDPDGQARRGPRRDPHPGLTAAPQPGDRRAAVIVLLTRRSWRRR